QHWFRKPGSLHSDPRGGIVDFAHIGLGQLDRGRSEVLFETLELARAWDRHDPGLLGEQPGERNLRGCGLLARGDAGQEVDDGHVGGAWVRGKGWRHIAEVGAAEARAGVDLARQKPRTERAEWDEADSELLADRQHAVVLHVSSPQ